jgi:hypothetical protein
MGEVLQFPWTKEDVEVARLRPLYLRELQRVEDLEFATVKRRKPRCRIVRAYVKAVRLQARRVLSW